MTLSMSTVLVVDDDAAIVWLLSEMLSGMGYSVIGSEDPMEAMTILGDTTKAIDVLISDYHMDEMSGAQLARCGFREAPTLKFVLMSGDPAALNRVRQEDLFLAKPFDLDQVQQMMGRVDSVTWPRPFRDRRQVTDPH